METNNFKVSISIVLFLIGSVTLGLSYFEKSTTALLYQLSSLLLLTVSVISLYLIYVSKKQQEIRVDLSENHDLENEEKKNEEMFKKNIISVDLDEDELTSDEKKVVKAIKKKDNKIEQRELTKKIFKGNKVKTYRVLSSLEEKDYIIKKKVGKINIIFLKKDF